MNLEFVKRITEIESKRQEYWDENTKLVEEKELLVAKELGDQCPFCPDGQINVFYDCIEPGGWTVECSNCGVQTPKTQTLSAALVYWEALLSAKDEAK